MQILSRHILLVFIHSFSGKDHQEVDFSGIHQLICTQLVPLRSSDAILGSEEERQEQARKLHSQKVL
jgi:hypothetical protein